MFKTPIHLQGNNFTLLVMHVHTSCLKDIRQTLEEKIKIAPHFLSQNTPIVINVSNITEHSNWSKLYHTILSTGLLIIGVCCCHNEQLKQEIIRSKLPILNIGNTIQYKYFSIHTDQSIYTKNISTTYKTQFINKPVRSGQTIYARNSDLIITTNVNTGAEIIADGNIHIYGTMRGRVLAGASGRKESQIFCTHLSPELISIGGHYLLSDQIPKEFIGKSVRLSLNKNTLIVQHL